MDEKKQNKIIIKNSAISIVTKGIQYVISFFTAPLLLSCLGDAKYGIYVSTLSLISWIYYFDFGIGSGMRNKVSESVTLGDYERAQKYVSLSYFLVAAITSAIFVIVVILLLCFDFEQILNASMSDESLNIIVGIAALLACINFVVSIGKNVLLAVQKTGLVDIFSVVGKIIMLISLILFVQFRINALIFVVLAEGITELIKNILAVVYADNKYPQLRFSKSKIDISLWKDILIFGFQIFAMQISALVLNTTDNLIIMKLFSAEDVTPYSLCHSYFSVINAFFVAATGPLWTTYTMAYTQKDVRYIKKTLKKALLFYALTFVGIIVALLIFKPFMRIYLGRELEYQAGLPILIAAYYALLIFSHNFSAFVNAISKVKYTTIACIIGAIVNIPASIVLATTFGMRLNGVIIGSILSLLISTGVYVYTALSEIKKMENNEKLQGE